MAETSDLTAPDGAPAPLVVDRPGWISANVDSFRALLDPVVDKLRRQRKSDQPGATATAIGGKVTGAEMGGLLAFLSSKVLGQYDLAPGGTPRLLLVAPNIVATERRSRSTRTTSAAGSPCTRRPTGCSSRPCRGCASTGQPDRRGSPSTSRRPRRTSPDGSSSSAGTSPTCSPRRGHRLTLRDPRAEGPHRPDDRRDVAPRGPRRRRDGRRRAPRHPQRRRDPPQVRPAPQRRGRCRPPAAQAARPRGQDAAVPRRCDLRSRPSWTRSAATASTPCGPRPRRCPDPKRSSSPAAWVRRVHG